MNLDILFQNIHFNINQKIFVKDPQSSDLGKNIVKKSIEFINEMGLEQFTFKKLALELQTAESSIYRYFDNKHMILIYLVSWYWKFQYHSLLYAVANLKNTKEKLKTALDIIILPSKKIQNIGVIEINALHQLIINESSKTYLTKEIDKENKEGFFMAYKTFCAELANIIKELNPQYKHPKSLAATVIEGIHHQKYFKERLPSLSDTENEQLASMYLDLISKTAGK